MILQPLPPALDGRATIVFAVVIPISQILAGHAFQGRDRREADRRVLIVQIVNQPRDGSAVVPVGRVLDGRYRAGRGFTAERFGIRRKTTAQQPGRQNHDPDLPVHSNPARCWQILSRHQGFLKANDYSSSNNPNTQLSDIHFQSPDLDIRLTDRLGISISTHTCHRQFGRRFQIDPMPDAGEHRPNPSASPQYQSDLLIPIHQRRARSGVSRRISEVADIRPIRIRFHAPHGSFVRKKLATVQILAKVLVGNMR